MIKRNFLIVGTFVVVGIAIVNIKLNENSKASGLSLQALESLTTESSIETRSCLLSAGSVEKSSYSATVYQICSPGVYCSNSSTYNIRGYVENGAEYGGCIPQ
jgi:hypothetical protein